MFSRPVKMSKEDEIMREEDLVIRAAVLRDEWAKQQDWTGVTQTIKTEMCCDKIYEIYLDLRCKAQNFSK